MRTLIGEGDPLRITFMLRQQTESNSHQRFPARVGGVLQAIDTAGAPFSIVTRESECVVETVLDVPLTDSDLFRRARIIFERLRAEMASHGLDLEWLPGMTGVHALKKDPVSKRLPLRTVADFHEGIRQSRRRRGDRNNFFLELFMFVLVRDLPKSDKAASAAKGKAKIATANDSLHQAMGSRSATPPPAKQQAELSAPLTPPEDDHDAVVPSLSSRAAIELPREPPTAPRTAVLSPPSSQLPSADERTATIHLQLNGVWVPAVIRASDIYDILNIPHDFDFQRFYDSFIKDRAIPGSK
ncbi:hypothetical protein HK105_204650 [Polyrhizophydium stewartii]|uniref:Uncharacterized protein n=1 Tax=Polyrhizophydium stewartii TaxID=2732419 RepID=A0ABR4N876_9FUNG